jgi:molybdate transport system substrate-binding protein
VAQTGRSGIRGFLQDATAINLTQKVGIPFGTREPGHQAAFATSLSHDLASIPLAKIGRMARVTRLLLILSLFAGAVLPDRLPAAGIAARADPLRVAAAADLKFAMAEVVALYEKGHPGEKVEIILGSSGKFYHQILNGAPFDLYFSADSEYPQQLMQQGLASAIRPYAVGRIVLWSAKRDASRMTLDDLARPEIRKIAIANPSHAPYGKRAQEALEKTGLWERVRNKLVFGENISQTAQYVDSGAVDVGIIALSLAVAPTLKNKGGHALIPDRLHAPLEQSFVILKRAERNPGARSFADFVSGREARAVMRAYGFELPGNDKP